MDPADLSDVGEVAAAAVSILGPYLGELAGKTTDALVDTTASTLAARLFELVKRKFHGSGKAEKDLVAFAAAPADSVAQASVKKSLATELERDPSFKSAVTSHLAQIANVRADMAFTNNFNGKVGKAAQFGTVNGDVSF